MTHLLWKCYVEDDVDRFRALLAPGGPLPGRSSGLASAPGVGSSPGHGTSPRAVAKSRRPQGPGHAPLGRHEVNSRDHAGLTLLLRAASSTSESAVAFVEALLEHPAIDIYVQDPESGWNALHRALYAGNISIARMLLKKEQRDLAAHTASLHRVGQLIKTKDHEGNSPFDLYHSTIGERSLRELAERGRGDAESDSDDDGASLDRGLSRSSSSSSRSRSRRRRRIRHRSSSRSNREKSSSSNSSGENPGGLAGEDLYAFGSNKNLSLGFADEDDRHFPERVSLRRPEDLVHQFYRTHLQQVGEDAPVSQDLARIPTLVRNPPLLIRDVVLAKLHSAVLTEDPVSNLYVCGVGRGGRLGLGDENTRFTYTPVQGPLADKRIVQVALGQDHSMAVDSSGSLWTWGRNAQCQLGYALPPPPTKDQDPISTVPRQVFGPLKKEIIVGVAASAIHSVAHTATSLYCWGKNVGQLALMDADSRSLELQQTPRKVAASLITSPIVMASAIDKATTVLLQNHTVCVFTAYGYHIVKFPFATLDLAGHIKLSGRHDPTWNQISYITSGGETIAALTKRGDLFTMSLDHKTDTDAPTGSTTNPSKIKSAVTQPQCIWSARKDGVRSVGVAEHGSVIVSTRSGAVWRRVKRSKAKDASSGPGESKRKDYKFQRVPCISRIAAVRASAYGAFAAIRKDSDIMKDQLQVRPQSLWDDVAPLSCLRGFKASEPQDKQDEAWKFWRPDKALELRLGTVAYEVLKSSDIDADMARHLASWSLQNDPLNVAVCTSSSPGVSIPVHGWLLAARSPVLRSALAQFRKTGLCEHEAFRIVADANGNNGPALICFHGLDLVSVLNLVLFAYEDRVIPVWNFTGLVPALAYRYRHIRQEVMRLATRLGMPNLEAAARLQVETKRCMDRDFQSAVKDRRFFSDGDALLVLDGAAEVPVHTALVCQRSPWFKGLFFGRSRGMWLAGRRAEASDGRIKIDLGHADPEAFSYVLRYLYGDCGAAMFDSAACDSVEDFMDLIMEVMYIADYLMLDRLSQICQRVMGQFANIRNIAHLLNAISPVAVTEFKDVGLEYVCLQLETLLENHLLDELDEHLLRELDKVVRGNQAAQSPFVRSGRAEDGLHERYPWLAEEIDEERQIRLKEMAFKALKEEERRLAASAGAKTRYGSPEDNGPATPTPDRFRKALRTEQQKEPSSPSLRPKESLGELIFNMDEETSPVASSSARNRRPEAALEPETTPSLGSSWKGAGKRVRINLWASPSASLDGTAQTPSKSAAAAPATSPDASATTPSKAGQPWATTALPTAKLDLRDIIRSESEKTNHSALTAGLAAQAAAPPKPVQQHKLSQKEKKRQQQAALAALREAQAEAPKKAWERGADEPSAGPWKSVGKTRAADADAGKKLLSPNSAAGPHTLPKPPGGSSSSSTSQSIPIHGRNASPDTRFAGQQRSTPTSITHAAAPTTPARVTPHQAQRQPPPPPAPPAPPAPSSPLVPHSKVYIPRETRPDPAAGLFRMEDIMTQETHAKLAVQEAAAAARKRSLQEIQEEQAFQEWWDAESKRVMEEEERRLERERLRELERERGRGRGGRGEEEGRGGEGASNCKEAEMGRVLRVGVREAMGMLGVGAAVLGSVEELPAVVGGAGGDAADAAGMLATPTTAAKATTSTTTTRPLRAGMARGAVHTPAAAPTITGGEERVGRAMDMVMGGEEEGRMRRCQHRQRQQHRQRRHEHVGAQVVRTIFPFRYKSSHRDEVVMPCREAGKCSITMFCTYGCDGVGMSHI
ncbi:hypothetical protein VTJ83DRAFT_5401 [Remersonia thermophila]|uniref:BTB domain-containing protein n=1 Tax=Remersonia thermophila TaxID=72144 RepID=A0ABR4D6R0_9PEZI